MFFFQELKVSHWMCSLSPETYVKVIKCFRNTTNIAFLKLIKNMFHMLFCQFGKWMIFPGGWTGKLFGQHRKKI